MIGIAGSLPALETKMGSMADALRRAGMAPAESAERTAPPTNTTESSDPDETAHAEWALRYGAALASLVGHQRAVKMLNAAADGGTNAARSAYESAVERALDALPMRRSNEVRTAFGCGVGMTPKGVPTFCACAREVVDALSDGSVERWVERERAAEDDASAAAPPALVDGEGEREYAERVAAWAAEIPAGIVRRVLGGDSPEWWARKQVRAAEERARETREAEERARDGEAIAAFERDGDYAALAAHVGARSLWRGGTLSTAEYVLASSRYAWGTLPGGGDSSNPPPDRWLGTAPLCQILYALVHPCNTGCHAERLRAALIQRLALAPNEAALLRTPSWEDYPEPLRRSTPPSAYAVTAEGRVYSCYGAGPGDYEAPARFPTVPHPGGWLALVGAGQGRGEAHYYGSSAYRALQLAASHTSRGLDVTDWWSAYGVAPERGFGRFRLGAVAGAAHSHHMFVSVDDRLKEHLASLLQIPKAEHVPWPEHALRVPARLVKRDQSRGHLAWDERAPTGFAYLRRGHITHMSRRSSGMSIGLATSGTTCAAWELSAATRAHVDTAVAAIVCEGETLALDTGLAVRCVGGRRVEVPGGAGSGDGIALPEEV